MDAISSSTTKPPTSNAKFFAVDSSSSDDDKSSNFEYEPLPQDKRVDENSASIQLTKIPLITKIMTFASLSPVSPLEFAQVHSSWNDAVRFFNAVSHVWSALFSETYLSHSLHRRLCRRHGQEGKVNASSSSSHHHKPQPLSSIMATLLQDDASGEDDENKLVDRKQISAARKQYDMKMETKQYIVPLICDRKSVASEFLRANDKDVFTEDLETDRRNRILLWYFEKVLDAGIDDELFLLNPIENHGTCLHIALRDQNLGALELICDAIVSRPHNRENAKLIFNLSSTLPSFASTDDADADKNSKVGQPIFACFPGEHSRSNPSSFAKLLQYAPDFVGVNAFYDGPTSKVLALQRLHQTVLHLICAHDFVQCAKHLIPLADRVGLDVNIVRTEFNKPSTALVIASHHGNDKIVDMLLNGLPPKAKSEVNVMFPFTIDEENDNTTSHLVSDDAVAAAVGRKHASCLKLLLNDPRVDVARANRSSPTSYLVILACRTKDNDADPEKGLECMRLLIDVAKCDINIIDVRNSSFSPLAAAVYSGNTQAVKFLISKGADLSWSSRSFPSLTALAKVNPTAKQKEIMETLIEPEKEGGGIMNLVRGFFGGGNKNDVEEEKKKEDEEKK